MYVEITVIVVLIIIIRHPAPIVMHRPLWLYQDIAHLHEEDIMEKVMEEEEGGKFFKVWKFKSRSLMLRLFYV